MLLLDTDVMVDYLRASALTIVHLVPALDGGGVETDVVGLSAALVRAGHKSIVVSGGGRLVEKIEADGGEHITWPVGKKSPATLLLIPRLRALLRERNADILHAHSRVPAWLGFLAWRGMKVARAPRPCACNTHSPTGEAPVPRPRFVTTMHGLNTPGWFSAVMLRSEKTIAVSDTVRAFVATHYPKADLSKVEVIERGVDPAAFPFGFKPDQAWLEAWQAQFPELAGRFVFTLAGRLTRLKGHLEALAALAQLRLEGVDAHLLLVGGEDPRRAGYAAEVRAAVAAKGLADRVTFTGHRSDIREVLAISSAVVSCSTKPETFGLSVLEAIRLGVPVAGYDHGGVGEVLGAVYPQGRVPFAGTPEARARALAEKLATMARHQLASPAAGDQFPLVQTHARTLALYKALTRVNG